MSSTVLALDLLLQEPLIDLRAASEIILSDVGATLQVLQLIADQHAASEDCFSSMAHCLASLDVQDWFDKISARTFRCDGEHAQTAAVWQHCRVIAQYAQFVAESIDGISAEAAYLIGLLHEIETIPSTLGWLNSADKPPALEAALPPFVHAALSSIKDSDSPPVWKCILTAAHHLAGAGIGFDPSMPASV